MRAFLKKWLSGKPTMALPDLPIASPMPSEYDDSFPDSWHSVEVVEGNGDPDWRLWEEAVLHQSGPPPANPSGSVPT